MEAALVPSFRVPFHSTVLRLARRLPTAIKLDPISAKPRCHTGLLLFLGSAVSVRLIPRRPAFGFTAKRGDAVLLQGRSRSIKAHEQPRATDFRLAEDAVLLPHVRDDDQSGSTFRSPDCRALHCARSAQFTKDFWRYHVQLLRIPHRMMPHYAPGGKVFKYVHTCSKAILIA